MSGQKSKTRTLEGIAGMKRLILLMMKTVVTEAWGYCQNMIFNKMIIARSKWLVTFAIDLKPYA